MNLILGTKTTLEVDSFSELLTLDIEAGNYVKTKSLTDDYLTTATSALGGALYEVTTLNLYRIKISDGGWVPGPNDAYMSNGNIAVRISAGKLDSVATMIGQDLRAGTIVETESYYAYSGSVEAKGGASYQILTLAQWQSLTGLTTPDGYGDHVLVNGNVARLNRDSINVLQYGAAGDGVAVDSVAIQAAIDSVDTFEGFQLDFPAGVYNLGTQGLFVKPLVLLNGLGSKAHGNDNNTQGQAAVVLLYSGTGWAVSVGDGATYNCFGGGVKNIGLFGNGVGVNGLRIIGRSGGATTGTILQDVGVNNFTGDGITCGPLAFIADFIRVDVRHCGTGLNLVAENNRYNFFSCDINFCTTGIICGSGSGIIQYAVELFGGRVENCETAILIQAPTRTVGLFGMYLEDFTTGGVICNTSGVTLSIISCNFDASGGNSISLSAGGMLNIIGNEFSGSCVNEINLGATAVQGIIKGNRHSSTVSGSRTTTPAPGSRIELNTTYAAGQAIHESHDYFAGTFTPTWNNLTVGNASVNTGWFTKIGRQVTVGVRIVFGSTTAITGGGVTVTNLPYNVDIRSFGIGNILDIGTANLDCRLDAAAGTSNIQFTAFNSTGSYVTPTNFNTTVPFTWATGDIIEGTVVYRSTT